MASTLKCPHCKKRIISSELKEQSLFDLAYSIEFDRDLFIGEASLSDEKMKEIDTQVQQHIELFFGLEKTPKELRDE